MTRLLNPLVSAISFGKRRAPVNPLAIAVFLAASAAANLAIFASVFGDPMGGEPVARLKIESGAFQTVMAPAPEGATPAEPSTEQTTYSDLERAAQQQALGAAGPTFAATAPAPQDSAIRPLRSLLNDGAYGPIPRVAPDGNRASKAYARPFDDREGRPRVALILSGMGLSQSTTAAALRELPPEVTLSFVPYAPNLEAWTDQARAKGHEVILELPMEPFDYPANDPGPYTLLTTHSRDDLRDRLDWLMGRFAGYFAVTNYLGAKFSTSNTSLKPLLEILEARGVAYIDDGSAPRSTLNQVTRNVGSEWTTIDRILDGRVSADWIDEQLLELEALALQNQAALGKGSAYPVTIAHIRDWARDLDRKGYVLAPASAVLRLRTER